MIKETKKQIFVLAAIASIGLSAPGAYAQVKDVVVDGKGEIPYVIDARNVVARSGAGLCWRTGYWSPAAASTVTDPPGRPAWPGEEPPEASDEAEIVDRHADFVRFVTDDIAARRRYHAAHRRSPCSQSSLRFAACPALS